MSGEGYSTILSSEHPPSGTKPFPALKGHYYCSPNNGNAPNFLTLRGLMCSSSEGTTLTSERTDVWAVNMKIPQKFIHSPKSNPDFKSDWHRKWFKISRYFLLWVIGREEGVKND